MEHTIVIRVPDDAHAGDVEEAVTTALRGLALITGTTRGVIFAPEVVEYHRERMTEAPEQPNPYECRWRFPITVERWQIESRMDHMLATDDFAVADHGGGYVVVERRTEDQWMVTPADGRGRLMTRAETLEELFPDG